MEALIVESGSWIADKSVLNMLGYYRSDLKRLLKGEFKICQIPLGTKKRFVEHGILRKFGSKFELTEYGRQLLINGI